MHRLNSMKETEMRNKIKDLKERLEVEKLVKDKIDHFINKKKVIIEQLADKRDKLRDSKITELVN